MPRLDKERKVFEEEGTTHPTIKPPTHRAGLLDYANGLLIAFCFRNFRTTPNFSASLTDFPKLSSNLDLTF